MEKPFIGITSSLTKMELNSPIPQVYQAYYDAMIRAGARIIFIPTNLDVDELVKILDELDGILFSGGGDIQPWRYGNSDHPKVDGINADRDRVEIFILRYIINRELPLLGICRGLQLVNVALGGALYEDILEQHPEAIRHQYGNEFKRDHLAHPIQVQPSSLFGQLIDNKFRDLLNPERILVNSMHHQGIRQLAPELVATAIAPDNIIEAVEIPGYPFGLAVQWHPECLPEYPLMCDLFSTFVTATQKKK
jgi:putative glutamine amidotransferase